jgi:hypothetical protein
VTCDAARERLLEADLRTLDIELQAHLDGCLDCRALADHLREAERRLAGEVARLTPPTDSGVAVRRSGAEARRRAGRRRGAAIATLAAAAGLAAVILSTRQPALPGGVPAVAARPPLAVTAPPGRNVAVLKTDNPDVVVFWFF